MQILVATYWFNSQSVRNMQTHKMKILKGPCAVCSHQKLLCEIKCLIQLIMIYLIFTFCVSVLQKTGLSSQLTYNQIGEAMLTCLFST